MKAKNDAFDHDMPLVHIEFPVNTSESEVVFAQRKLTLTLCPPPYPLQLTTSCQENAKHSCSCSKSLPQMMTASRVKYIRIRRVALTQ